MVPDLKHVVQAIRDGNLWDFSTKAGLCAYSHAVVAALHRANPNFGHLAKSASQNHCVDPLERRVAVDVVLFQPTGQVIDFIVSAGFGEGQANAVAWSVGPAGEYTADQWILPADVMTLPPPKPDPEPVPDPEPAPAPWPIVGGQIEILRERIEAINTALDSRLTAVEDSIYGLDTRLYRGDVKLFGRTVGTVISQPVRE